MNTKSIILLSGGLDCATSLASCIKSDNIQLALFFNYGQKAYEKELLAAKQLSDYYNIKLEEIKLDWLKNITKTSLVSDNSIPVNDEINIADKNKSFKSMQKVWVPNRNGLFLNIAASYADSFGYNKIFIGANKEEAKTFVDNSKEFIAATNNELQYSTLAKPEIVAPLINLNKNEIIKLANENNLPFNLLWSCYFSNDKHCGECESCLRLKKGLEYNGLFGILDLLF